jgi:hypothetical protein
MIAFTARKYEVSGLINLCSKNINENITPENAMIVLDYSLGKVVTFDSEMEMKLPLDRIRIAFWEKTTCVLEKKMEISALEVVSQNTKEVFNSEAFLQAADASIEAVLRLRGLSVREVDVFQAVNLHIAKIKKCKI